MRQLAINFNPPPPPELSRFDGVTYDHGRDGLRLNAQLQRVFDVMETGNWYSLDDLHEITGDPHASISARIRDLRKERFGGHVVQRENTGNGLWKYRLVIL